MVKKNNIIVTFGLKNVKYALATINNGVISYGEVKNLKGAQELSSDMIDGNSKVYGDDYTLAELNAFIGNNVTLKTTEVPAEFKIDVLGYQYDENNNLVEVLSNQVRPFSLGCEIDGGKQKRRLWFVFCIASPISEGTKSKTDSVEANSFTLNITNYAIEKNGHEYLKVITREENQNYDAFFDQVPCILIHQKILMMTHLFQLRESSL